MVPWRQYHPPQRLRQRETHPMAIQVASIHRRQAHNRSKPKWHHLKLQSRARRRPISAGCYQPTANASMFGREQYFPKAITSAPHFGNEMAAPLQSSRQPTYSDFLAYINASTAMYHDLTTSQAPPTTWLMLYPVIFIYRGLI